MAYITINTKYPIYDGMPITFEAPCNCNAAEGLCVNSVNFVFKDAHGNALTRMSNLFVAGVYVKVILDVENGFAYIQNADTNAYLEAQIANVLNTAASVASGKVSVHESSKTAHSDIREALEAKLGADDIINNLTTYSPSQPLSAAQGYLLQQQINNLNVDCNTLVATYNVTAAATIETALSAGKVVVVKATAGTRDRYYHLWEHETDSGYATFINFEWSNGSSTFTDFKLYTIIVNFASGAWSMNSYTMS